MTRILTDCPTPTARSLRDWPSALVLITALTLVLFAACGDDSSGNTGEGDGDMAVAGDTATELDSGPQTDTSAADTSSQADTGNTGVDQGAVDQGLSDVTGDDTGGDDATDLTADASGEDLLADTIGDDTSASDTSGSDASDATLDSYDATPEVTPVIVHFPFPSSLTNAETLTLRGTTVHDRTVTLVTVGDVEATSDDQFETWTAEVTLALGTNVISITLQDELDNVFPNAATVTVERAEWLLGQFGPIAVPPGEAVAYLLNRIGSSRTPSGVFAINLESGSTTLISGGDVGSGDGFTSPRDIAWDAVGDRLLVTECCYAEAALVAVDPDSGARTPISSADVGSGEDFGVVTHLATDGTTAFVAKGTDQVLEINLADGVRTILTDADTHGDGALDDITGMALSPSGLQLYLSDRRNRQIVQVDTSSEASRGTRTTVAQTDTFETLGTALPGGLAVRSTIDGDVIYATDVVHGVYRVAALTGAITLVSAGDISGAAPLDAEVDVALYGDDQLIVSVNALDALLSISEQTGARSAIGAQTFGAGDHLLRPRPLVATEGELYVGRSQTEAVVFQLDIATGDREIVATPALDDEPVRAGHLVLDSAGDRLIGTETSFARLVAIDLSNGATSVLSSPDVGEGDPILRPTALGLIGDPYDTAVVLEPAYDSVLLIDLSTGDRTVLSDDTNGTGDPLDIPNGMVVDEAGGRAFVTDRSANTVIAVDLTIGDRLIISGGEVGEGPALFGPQLPAYDAARNLLYLSNDQNHSIITIDPTDGSREVVASDTVGTGPLSFPSGRLRALVFHVPSGTLLATDDDRGSLVQIDPVSGDRVILSR